MEKVLGFHKNSPQLNSCPISLSPHSPPPQSKAKETSFLPHPPSEAIHFQPIYLNTIPNTSSKDLKKMGKEIPQESLQDDQLPWQNWEIKRDNGLIYTKIFLNCYPELPRGNQGPMYFLRPQMPG